MHTSPHVHLHSHTETEQK